MSKQLLETLNDQFRQRGKATISLAAWDCLSNKGENYLKLTDKTYTDRTH